MSENEGAASQADETAQPQAGADQQTTGQAPETIDSLPGWAQKLIRETRKEAASHRSKLQEFEDANKTELQRAIDRAAELEKRYGETEQALRAERVEKAIRDAAASAGARADRLAAIYRLVRDDVSFDDNGQPSNVAAVVEKAKAESPEWFSRVAGSGDGGKGGGSTGSDPNAVMNAAIRQLAGHA